MRPAIFFAVIVVFGFGNCHAAAPSPCPSLREGKSFKGAVSSLHPSCFSLTVAPGEVVQLTVAQSEDLAIHLTGKGTDAVFDGFDLGNETLTISTAGRYRVEVGFAPGAAAPGGSTFWISRKPLAPGAAPAWQEAEHWATVSKKSRGKDDIAKSLTLWASLGDPSSVARTYLKEGNRASRSGDPAAARAAHEQALALCLTIPDIRCAAEAELYTCMMGRRAPCNDS